LALLKEIQNMMKTLYFDRDQKRGKIETYNWLKEEIEELCEALRQNDNKVLEAEFADVIAWLASLANMRNIDLDKASHAKYYCLCP
jgi:NTP pyrophosphatase (non-canonical NTP hydrolase)